MNKIEKNGKKAIGIAMAAIMIASVFAMVAPVLGHFRPVDPAPNEAVYYLGPDASSESYCNSATVQLHINSTRPFCILEPRWEWQPR